MHYSFFKVKSDSFGLLKSYMLLFYLPSSTAFTSHSFPYKITLHFLQSDQLYSAILLYPLCTFFYIYIYPLFLTAPFSIALIISLIPQDSLLYCLPTPFPASGTPLLLLPVLLFYYLGSCRLHIHI